MAGRHRPGLHVPVLRPTGAYRSLDTVELTDIRDGEPVASVSQANPGLVARDLAGKVERRRKLGEIPIDELLAIAKRAAKLFTEGEVLVDPVDGVMQSPDDYIRQLSATTGLPEVMARANMAKVAFVLSEMDEVLGGLTRGLDLRILEDGHGVQDGRTVSYQSQADVLGAVLPANSPGVHALWIPSIGLKVPLALKPGRREPWTPFRVAQAFVAAGLPADAIGFYPTSHAGATQILNHTDRSLLFGDADTVAGWKSDERVQIHGPGWSKVLLAGDDADGWERHLDILVSSIADNGGRSCINASGVWATTRAAEIADGLARELAAVEAKPLDDPGARLAAFAEPRVAHAVSAYVDDLLTQSGAEDVTARYRAGGRVAEVDGCTFLLPTVVHCTDPTHPLASCEFLFPFVAVCEAPRERLLSGIGSTLVATVLGDGAFRQDALRSSNIERLNLGGLPTSRVTWDQPHEGNLFEHLYRQRAFQAASGA